MDYDQPVTVLAQNGACEHTTLGAVLHRLLADPTLLPGLGVLLAADNRLLTSLSEFQSIMQPDEPACTPANDP